MWHRHLQTAAIEAALELRTHRIDLCQDAVDAFAVSGVGNRFTAAKVLAVTQFRNYDDGLGLAAAADVERACDRPVLNGRSEDKGRAHSRNPRDLSATVEVQSVPPGASQKGGRSVEPPSRMREHCVNLARFRSQISSRHHLTAVVARYLIEQAFELADVAVYRLFELAIRSILFADVVERLLTLKGIKPSGENIAFAALIAVPQIGGRVVIDHSRDVNRKRIQ